MALINNAEVIGGGGKNLVLETAGHIYVKVNERYYELDFKNSKANNNLTGRTVVNETIEKVEEVDLSDYITNDDLKKTLKKYVTERTWEDVMSTQQALQDSLLDFEDSIKPITIQTMQVVVGTEELQFDWVKSFTNMDYKTTDPPLYIDENESSDHYGALVWNPGYIKHYTIDGPSAVQPETEDNADSKIKEYWRWYIMNSEGKNEIEEINLSDTFYVYLKVPHTTVANADSTTDTVGQGHSGANLYITEDGAPGTKIGTGKYAKTGIGQVVYSSEAIEFGPTYDSATELNYYHLLYAIVTNSDGSPSIATLNGFTEILPGQIRAYLFASPDGESYLDLRKDVLKLSDKLVYNIDGKGNLYMKGAIIQDKGGNGNSAEVYRNEWSETDTYCPGNIVTYTDLNGITGTYRFKGVLPEGKTENEVLEYERNCGTAGNPITDTDHWVCVSKGSQSIITSGIYYVDSDDDFTAIPTDENGTIQAEIPSWDLNIKMYEGDTSITILDSRCSFTVPSAISEAVTVTAKGSGVYTIKVNKGKVINGTYKIPFTIVAQPRDAAASPIQRVFSYTISGVQNADPNTMYFLKPSVSSIKKNKTGSISPANIYCEVFKNNPNLSGILTSYDSGMAIQYSIDGGSWIDYTYKANIGTNSISSKIEFKLTIGGVLYDRETVFINEDGVSVTNINEYYYATNNASETPSKDSDSIWKRTIAATGYGPNKKYLWNYEEILDSKGSTINAVNPALICVYGKDGAGISSVSNYYFTTTSTDPPAAVLGSDGKPYNSEASVGSADYYWTTSPSTLNHSHSKDYPYLWNVEVIHFETNEDGSTKPDYMTSPAIIGVFTVDGINAGIIRLSASSYVFSYPSVTASKPTNETITLNAYTQNVKDTTFEWKYKNSTQTSFTSISGVGTGAEISIPYNSPIFSNNSVTIRAEVDDPNNSSGKLYDEITLFKVYATSGNTFTSYLENPCIDIPVVGGNKDYTNAYSTLHVILNGSELASDQYAVSSSDSDVKWDRSNKRVYIDSTSKTRGRYYANITIKYEEYTSTLTFEYELDSDGYVTLTYPESAFVYDGTAYTPSSITLTVNSYNSKGEAVTGSYSWYYLNVSKQWVKINGYSAATLAIEPSSAYFNGRTASIKCVDSTLNDDYDTVTLYKVQDGDDGDDAISVFLTNPSHTFAGTNTAATSATDSCGVLLYEGDTLKGTGSYSIALKSGYSAPTGMSIDLNPTTKVNVNGTNVHTFNVTVNSNLTKASNASGGTIPINVTYNQKVIATLNYSWSVSWSGDPGVGSAGPTGPSTRWTKWKSGVSYCQGNTNTGEKFIDFVYYGGKNYQCISSHLSSDSILPDSASTYWSEINNMEPVATSVLLVGDGASGWQIDEGVISHNSNKAKLDKSGNIYLGNNSSGVITASNANFSVNGSTGDVKLKGDITIDYGNTFTVDGPYTFNLSRIPGSSESPGGLLGQTKTDYDLRRPGCVGKTFEFRETTYTIIEAQVPHRPGFIRAKAPNDSAYAFYFKGNVTKDNICEIGNNIVSASYNEDITELNTFFGDQFFDISSTYSKSSQEWSPKKITVGPSTSGVFSGKYLAAGTRITVNCTPACEIINSGGDNLNPDNEVDTRCYVEYILSSSNPSSSYTYDGNIITISTNGTYSLSAQLYCDVSFNEYNSDWNAYGNANIDLGSSIINSYSIWTSTDDKTTAMIGNNGTKIMLSGGFSLECLTDGSNPYIKLQGLDNGGENIYIKLSKNGIKIKNVGDDDERTL